MSGKTLLMSTAAALLSANIALSAPAKKKSTGKPAAKPAKAAKAAPAKKPVKTETAEIEPVKVEKMSVGNGIVTVKIDAASGRFTLWHRGEKKPFAGPVEPLALTGAVTASGPEKAKSVIFGEGSRLTLSGDGGGRLVLTVYDGFPFVFIDSRIGNKAEEPLPVVKMPMFRFPVKTGGDFQKARVQGTGFLSTPDKNPGSYVYMAVADAETNNGVVAAWLTQERGSGVVFAGKDAAGATLTAQLDYGNLIVPPKSSAEAETFVVGYFDDARKGLEQYADLVALRYNIKLRPIIDGYCTWYSDPHGQANDEQNLKLLAKTAEKELQPYGLDFIQIDDMWQDGERRNGPAKNFHLSKKAWPYPKGMRAAAADLEKRGFVPGIWWMPFAGDQRDPFYKKHPDWFVKNKKGEPYETPWGGTSLDMTNPGARKYTAENAARMAKEWGYKYFKMDGLYTGLAVKQQYVNHAYQWDDIGDAVFSEPGVTNVEAFRSGLKLVRASAGDDVFFLGCTNAQNMRSFGASFGLVDAMRIGEDNGAAWDSLLAGPRAGSSRYFLNGRVWWNDPDPVYIRPAIPVEHARLITSWVGLTGQVMTFSEWLPQMPPERVQILQRIIPNHGLRPRPADFFESVIPRVWVLNGEGKSAGRHVIGLFNWDSANPAHITYDPVKAGLPRAKLYNGFDFWADEFLPPFRTIDFTVPAGSARIIAARPISERPMVISTNRHISQGIVDVRAERWSGTTLSGTSSVIGGETYELRIVAPYGETRYELASASVDGKIAKLTFKQDGDNIRVRIDNPENAEVKWRLNFVPRHR